MPKILRRNLPEQVYAHLLERVQQRNISGKQLTLMVDWFDTQPDVPQGKWFRRFPGMIVCGEGELVKTFLVPGQVPTGEEIQVAPARQAAHLDTAAMASEGPQGTDRELSSARSAFDGTSSVE